MYCLRRDYNTIKECATPCYYQAIGILVPKLVGQLVGFDTQASYHYWFQLFLSEVLSLGLSGVMANSAGQSSVPLQSRPV
jgi:hypothetical protein